MQNEKTNFNLISEDEVDEYFFEVIAEFNLDNEAQKKYNMMNINEKRVFLKENAQYQVQNIIII